MSDLTADKLVSAYINLKAQRTQLLAEFESADSVLKTQQDMISQKLLELCKEVGADSLKTKHGTASRRVSTRYETTDWGSLYDFIKEHEALQLLEQRIHQGNMKAFLEDHPDLLPPGLNTNRRYTIAVRKVTNKI
jgi:hypothetical protein